MTSKTLIQLIDDVDGEEADETIEFALDGVTFNIDLSATNAEALREAFAPFADAGRRTGGRARRQILLPEATRGFSVAERRAMQRFAESNDLNPPATRGRIAAEVSQAWEAAGRPM